MQSQDLYIRITDPNGVRRTIVSHHRVWDRDRFMAATREQYLKPDRDEDKRHISVATEDEYRAFMGYKGH